MDSVRRGLCRQLFLLPVFLFHLTLLNKQFFKKGAAARFLLLQEEQIQILTERPPQWRLRSCVQLNSFGSVGQSVWACLCFVLCVFVFFINERIQQNSVFGLNVFWVHWSEKLESGHKGHVIIACFLGVALRWRVGWAGVTVHQWLAKTKIHTFTLVWKPAQLTVMENKKHEAIILRLVMNCSWNNWTKTTILHAQILHRVRGFAPNTTKLSVCEFSGTGSQKHVLLEKGLLPGTNIVNFKSVAHWRLQFGFVGGRHWTQCFRWNNNHRLKNTGLFHWVLLPFHDKRWTRKNIYFMRIILLFCIWNHCKKDQQKGQQLVKTRILCFLCSGLRNKELSAKSIPWTHACRKTRVWGIVTCDKYPLERATEVWTPPPNWG